MQEKKIRIKVELLQGVFLHLNLGSDKPTLLAKCRSALPSKILLLCLMGLKYLLFFALTCKQSVQNSSEVWCGSVRLFSHEETPCGMLQKQIRVRCTDTLKQSVCALCPSRFVSWLFPVRWDAAFSPARFTCLIGLADFFLVFYIN